MKEETKKTEQFARTQIDDTNSKKKNEREEFVKPPEVFYTDKELAALKAEADERNREVKTHAAEYAKDLLTHHLTKTQKEQIERERAIAEDGEKFIEEWKNLRNKIEIIKEEQEEIEIMKWTT